MMKQDRNIPEKIETGLDATEEESASALRLYQLSAWAFLWAPLGMVMLSYIGDALSFVRPVLGPLFAVCVFGCPMLLLSAVVVVLQSERRGRWIFAVLDAGALVMTLVMALNGLSYASLYR